MHTALGLFIIGLSFGAGPCLVSCGPLLASYIAGTGKNMVQAVLAYFVFSLARIAAYLGLGLGLFFTGKAAVEQFLGKASGYLYFIDGFFLILIGLLVMAGRALESKACRFLERNILERDLKSIVALGLLTGFLPCAPLVAVFSYTLLISRSWISSLLYLLAFGLGTFFSPLLAVAIGAGFIRRIRGNSRGWQEKIFNLACGAMIIYLGIELIRRLF
jgi:sulfite exporter TauE/SafE